MCRGATSGIGGNRHIDMTDFTDILASPDSVDDALNASSKKGLFAQLATVASRRTGLDQKQIAAALNEREKTGSTGFGGGIAIPHGKVTGLGKIVGLFVRLAVPLQYQSVDHLPVDLVFLLLSPPDAGADHLKVLARVSRAMRDKQVLAKLRGARSKDAIYAVLTGAEARDAA
jgi:PTS system nitrogen regulatory IIA component